MQTWTLHGSKHKLASAAHCVTVLIFKNLQLQLTAVTKKSDTGAFTWHECMHKMFIACYWAIANVKNYLLLKYWLYRKKYLIRYIQESGRHWSLLCQNECYNQFTCVTYDCSKIMVGHFEWKSRVSEVENKFMILTQVACTIR